MKEAIRQRAIEMGFDGCRFATAEPPASAARFQDWLDAHHHGRMDYLERNAGKRLDPRSVLADVKCVITLAASYHIADFQPPGAEGSVAVVEARSTPHSALRTPHSSVIARYARFDDYHDVLGERLKALAESVTQLGGGSARSLWYVDTGPVLEREFAQRAGLGFIGKHTNVISRKLGNWIFLAEILTSLELDPDEPEKNHCGSCTRCIAACPTGAITAPFRLDARLCISYLTIELKGPIPIELRPAIGDHIFGCDDCLAVCPWNRFAREGSLMKAHTRPDFATPDLVEMLRLDNAGFKKRFAGTPMLRTKRRGLLRNVCVALGNVGEANALPELSRAAGDAEPLIAEHANWAVEQITTRTRVG